MAGPGEASWRGPPTVRQSPKLAVYVLRPAVVLTNFVHGLNPRALLKLRIPDVGIRFGVIAFA